MYFLIRNAVGQIWNGSAFASYSSGSFSSYPVNATEQGSASGFYTATFPSTIIPGVYSIVGKVRAGGSPAESDATIAEGNYEWSGTATLPLSDLATSGQIANFTPIQMAHGCMVRYFGFYLKSSADHVTPFTSGICSGQIARDNGNFVALQSGAFTERGNGFYYVQALTSGDLDANTASLLFSANGISGGSADPCPVTLVLQRTSGA